MHSRTAASPRVGPVRQVPSEDRVGDLCAGGRVAICKTAQLVEQTARFAHVAGQELELPIQAPRSGATSPSSWTVATKSPVSSRQVSCSSLAAGAAARTRAFEVPKTTSDQPRRGLRSQHRCAKRRRGRMRAGEVRQHCGLFRAAVGTGDDQPETTMARPDVRPVLLDVAEKIREQLDEVAVRLRDRRIVSCGNRDLSRSLVRSADRAGDKEVVDRAKSLCLRRHLVDRYIVAEHGDRPPGEERGEKSRPEGVFGHHTAAARRIGGVTSRRLPDLDLSH
jgi:hypothetical protein